MAAATPLGTPLLRFGVFELDPMSGELRKSGALVRLKPQPFKVLVLLAAHPGQMVTREEIQREVWGEGTFVDFEQGVNHCIKEIRTALGDDAETPRYVETLPRRGYRFIAPVNATGAAAVAPESAPSIAPRRLVRPAAAWAATGLLVVVLVAGVALWPRSGHRAPAPRSKLMLAVLPFENLSGDPTQEYLSDGLTEEMITQLGRMQPERLGVIARTSAMAYKGTRKSAADVARELKVDYILEGSLRRSGDRVRVSAQLIEARDQTHLWAENYDRELRDVLAVQGEIASAIAREIDLKLSPQQRARLTRAVKAEAYEAYLKGRYCWNQRTPEGLKTGIDLFREAVGRDPTYALAWAGLADCYMLLPAYLVEPAQEAFPRGKQAAAKALELDPSLGEPHISLAYAQFRYDWNWSQAETEFRQGLSLIPNYATGHDWYAEYLAMMGRWDESSAEVQRAAELDPLSRSIRADEGWFLYLGRRPDAAIHRLRQVLEQEPGFAIAHFYLGEAYAQKGLHDEAIAEFRRARELGAGGIAAVGLIHSYALTGRRSEALAELARLEEARGGVYTSPTRLAMIQAALGDKRRALDLLERAWRDHDDRIVCLKVHPFLDPLRGEPRFEDLMRRLALVE